MPPPTFTVNSAMVNVNVKDTSKILYLPLANTIQGNTITIRDATGFCSPASSIYVSTLATNSINNGLSVIRMTNPLQSLRLFSQPNNYQVTQNFIFPPPSIPTNLSLFINGGTRIVSLRWNPSSNTNSYEWSFYATDLSNVTILSATTTNTVINILPPIILNTFYSFRVRAIGFGGASAYAISPSVVYALPPDPPTDLSLTIVKTTGFTTMSWTGSAAAATYTWVLYRSATPPVVISQNTTSVSLVTLTIAPVRGDYYFTVYASSAVGDSATVTLTPTVFYDPPPSNPSNLSLTIPNDTGLASMSWTASATNVTGYDWKLYKVGTGTAVATGSTTTATTASYSVVNIPGDYYFTVTATGLGGSSDTIQSTPDTNYNPPPTNPSNLAISISDTTGVVTMSWTASLNAIDYTWSLYRDVSGSGSIVATDTVSGSPATYTIQSPFTPGNYYFILRARGNGGFSQSVQSSTDNYNPPPTNPSNLSLTINNSTGAVLMSWTASFNATSGYSWKFYRATGDVLVTSGTTSGTSASYTIQSPFTPGNYYFTVQASGNGGNSAVIQSTNTNYNPPASIPTNLSLTIPNSTGLASMSWTASFNATNYGYTLFRLNGVVPVVVISSFIANTSVTYSLAPEYVAGSYYFAVYAIGNGGNSDTAISTPLVNYNPPPTNPSSLSLSISNSTGEASMSWTASKNASFGYSWKFYRATGDVLVSSGSTSGTSASYTIQTPFTPGNYYFTVQASGPGGDSDTIQSTNTNYNPPPTKPSNLLLFMSNQSTGGSAFQVTMSWQSSLNVTSYRWNLYNPSNVIIQTNLTTGTFVDTYIVQDYTPGNYYFIVIANGNVGAGNTTSDPSNTVTFNPIPTNPTNLSLYIDPLDPIFGSVVMSWTASVNATSYAWALYRSGNATAVTTGTTSDTSAISSVAPTNIPGTYYFTLVATGNGGSTGIVTSGNFSYAPIPSPATGLTLSISNTSPYSVTMSWTAGPNTVSYTYRLYNASGPTQVASGPTTNTSVTITPSLTSSAYYYFDVVSTNAVGSFESAPSDTVQFLPIPVTPTNLSLTITGPTNVTMSWTASQYATSYSYSLFNSNTGGVNVGGTTATTSVTPTITNALSEGTPYYFTVAAQGIGGFSDPARSSNYVTPYLPGVASALSLTIGSINTTTIMSWTAGSDATSYDWRLFNSANNTTVTSGNTANTSLTISPSLTSYTNYKFSIVSKNSFGTAATVESSPVLYAAMTILVSDVASPAIWFDSSYTTNITSNAGSSNVTGWSNRGSITVSAISNASYTPPKTNQATQAGLNLITYATSNNLIITSMSLPTSSRSCFALYRQKVNIADNGLGITFLRGA